MKRFPLPKKHTPDPAQNAKRRPLLLGAAGVLTALLVGFYGYCCVQSARSTAIFPRVSVGDVPVAGLERAQAQERLQEQLPLRCAERTIDLRQGDASVYSLRYSALGVCADYAAEAQNAYDWCKGASLPVQALHYGQALLLGKDFSPALAPQEPAFSQAVAELAQELYRSPLEWSWQVQTDSLLITLPRDGQEVQQPLLREALLCAVREGTAAVDCPFTTLPAAPWSMEQLESLSGEMCNAAYDPATESITPERTGISFDLTQARELLTSAPAGSTVELPAVITQPQLTAQQLEPLLFRDVLGSCTTRVGGTEGRQKNVRLSAASIDGIVLNSGEVFDYNSTVGPRTAANGYSPAPAYVQGETVDTLGGGICQTSSTLYRAAVLSNLEIVERSPHGYVSSYIGKGYDATVSWGGPEFRFRNDSLYPVKIQVSWKGSYLTVSLLGSNPEGISVEFTNEVVSTTPFEEQRIETEELPAGTEEVKVTPYTGYVVNTYRKVYDRNGQLLSEKLEAVNRYHSRDRVVLVGTAKPAPAETTPDPSAELPTEEAPNSSAEASAAEVSAETKPLSPAPETEVPAEEAPSEAASASPDPAP